MSKTILITGGAGFIGSHFVHFILNNCPTWKVINLDAITYAGDLQNLRDIEDNKNYTFIYGDITQPEQALLPFRDHNIDYVVHMAAETHVDNSIASSEKCVITNILGTRILLEHARDHKVKKFLYVSTDEVYGSLSLEDKQWMEESLLSPSSPYSASKASGEFLCRAFYKTHGLPVLITRSSNNYGPNQFPEKLIPLFIKNLLTGNPVPVYGKGNNIRDWLHVTDNCRAIFNVLEKGNIGEIYNVGADNELTNLQITKRLIILLNKDENLIKFVKDRPGHDLRYSVNSNKIKETLGWKPQIDFLTGLSETVGWYQNKWQITE